VRLLFFCFCFGNEGKIPVCGWCPPLCRIHQGLQFRPSSSDAGLCLHPFGVASPWKRTVRRTSRRDAWAAILGAPPATPSEIVNVTAAMPWPYPRPHPHSDVLEEEGSLPPHCHCAHGRCTATPIHSRPVRSSGRSGVPPSRRSDCGIGCRTWSECACDGMCCEIC